MAAGATNPDVYFVSAYEPSLTALGKQIQVAEKVHGMDLNVASIVAISLAPDCGSSRAPGTPTATCPGRRCSEQFLKAFPASELITHMMPYAYDSVRIFVDGIESDEAWSRICKTSPGTTARTASSPVNPAVAISAPRRSSGWSRMAAPRSKPPAVPAQGVPASDPDADASQPANPHAPTTNASQPANPHAPSTNAN